MTHSAKTQSVVERLSDKPIYLSGDSLSPADIAALSKFPSQRVMQFFEKATDIVAPTFLVTFECHQCRVAVTQGMGKSKIEKLLQSCRTELLPPKTNKRGRTVERPLCAGCQSEVHRAEREARRNQSEQWADKVEMRRKHFCENYLDPERAWNKSTPHIQRWNAIESGTRFDVSAEIKALEYSEFLKTPFWKAVAWRVKKRAGFRCQTCGTSSGLDAHHRSYELHGYEHTYEGMKELIALCRECHVKFHFEE